ANHGDRHWSRRPRAGRHRNHVPPDASLSAIEARGTRGDAADHGRAARPRWARNRRMEDRSDGTGLAWTTSAAAQHASRRARRSAVRARYSCDPGEPRRHAGALARIVWRRRGNRRAGRRRARTDHGAPGTAREPAAVGIARHFSRAATATATAATATTTAATGAIRCPRA